MRSVIKFTIFIVVAAIYIFPCLYLVDKFAGMQACDDIYGLIIVPVMATVLAYITCQVLKSMIKYILHA